MIFVFSNSRSVLFPKHILALNYEHLLIIGILFISLSKQNSFDFANLFCFYLSFLITFNPKGEQRISI